MGRVVITLCVLGLALGAVESTAQNPYEQPLKPTGFTLQAVALPPRAIGQTVLRAKSALAVAVQVTVEHYLPRALEPTLLINGAPAGAASGVTTVQGRLTTLSFLVESPELLKDGATVEIQIGDDPKTRTRVPGVLRRADIGPPDQEQARRLGLPTLAEWLSKPASN